MKTFLTLVIPFAFVCLSSASNIEYDGWLNIRLQHAFGPNNLFTDRGNITIQSVRSGSFILDQNPLTPEDYQALKEAVKSDGFYKLRSITQASDGSENIFLSSIKAETLLSMNFHDVVVVWVLHSGSVASVGISPSIFEPSLQRTSPIKFSTEVYVRHVEQAPVPDTASYIQKLEREREAREKGEFKDNRSFLAKYWMYIVPVVIFVLLSGTAGPEQGSAR